MQILKMIKPRGNGSFGRFVDYTNDKRIFRFSFYFNEKMLKLFRQMGTEFFNVIEFNIVFNELYIL
jgi:hypothetical protein